MNREDFQEHKPHTTAPLVFQGILAIHATLRAGPPIALCGTLPLSDPGDGLDDASSAPSASERF